MSRSAHLAIGEDLRHGVFGGCALFALISAGQVSDVVSRVVIADVLQGSGNGLDQVALGDGGHGGCAYLSGAHRLRGR